MSIFLVFVLPRLSVCHAGRKKKHTHTHTLIVVLEDKNPRLCSCSPLPLVPLFWNLFHLGSVNTWNWPVERKEKESSKGKNGRWEGGGGAVVKLASDHLLSGILCRGQSSGAAVWRCDWLRKGEMKTTVNFWPRRRSSAGTPSPSSGVVEQSPLSSCVYSTNPTGTVGRGGGESTEREERKTQGREGGREGGRREKIVRAALLLRSENEYLLFYRVAQLKRVHKHTQSKVKTKLFSIRNVAKSHHNGWHISTLNYLRLRVSSHCITISPSEDVCVIRTGSMAADQGPGALALQIKGCLAID